MAQVADGSGGTVTKDAKRPLTLAEMLQQAHGSHEQTMKDNADRSTWRSWEHRPFDFPMKVISGMSTTPGEIRDEFTEELMFPPGPLHKPIEGVPRGKLVPNLEGKRLNPQDAKEAKDTEGLPDPTYINVYSDVYGFTHDIYVYEPAQ